MTRRATLFCHVLTRFNWPHPARELCTLFNSYCWVGLNIANDIPTFRLVLDYLTHND